jgi:hypothetical protein
MKPERNQLITVVLVVTMAACTSPATAYPPDNAAVLYYRAFMLYEAEDEIKGTLDDYRQGRIELNETIENYLAKHQRIIDMVLDATRIDHCDWGLDYAEGTEVVLAPHYQVRDIFFLIAPEAIMRADKGDPKKALEHMVAMYRMARHFNERPLTCYLVGTAITAATHKCVTRIVSEWPVEVDTLMWLQAQLAEFDERPYSIKPVLKWKREAAIISMSPERIGNAVQAGLDDGAFKTKILERIGKADPEFYARNIAYWNNFMERVEAAFDMPYAQAYAELGRLDKQLPQDFDSNPDATLAVCFAPTFQRIYSLNIRLKAQSNALRAAVAVYLSHAKTGRRPEALPVALPRDPFSGKPFVYERTDEGFMLRCQSDDLLRNEAYEFEYKVKK